ncbi:hypothetical protein C8Q80DRAFT_1108999 [Daedaleopsis nitida]|nr:hypothetical protein C8Q80DRAFT_1108999 [Daedaleopsis nitida]
MSGQASRKRTRMDEEAGEEPRDHGVDGRDRSDTGELQRDKDFWFEDGSIVLHARNVAFKVYALPLIKHSPVFKDMLSLPQPDADGDVAALPVVSLSDSPEDLRHAFQILMPNDTLRPFGFKIHYNLISAWIRIGHKYEINSLVEHSIRYLRQLYPDNYADYEKFHAAAFDGGKAIGIVNIARLTGAHRLLPAALMYCCQVESDLAYGFPREDGTMERLSRTDLDICFKASKNLVAARVSLAHRLFKIEHIIDTDECDDQVACTEAIEGILDDLVTAELPGLYTPRPLSSFMSEYAEQLDVCESCRGQLFIKSEAERRAIFEDLPALLGITVNGWGNNGGTSG